MNDENPQSSPPPPLRPPQKTWPNLFLHSSTTMLLALLPTVFNHTKIFISWKFPFLNRMNRSGDRYLIFLNSRVFGITMRWYVCVIWAQPVEESPCLNKSLHWPATAKSNGRMDERLSSTNVRYYNFISSEMFQFKLLCHFRCFHFYTLTPYLPTYLPTQLMNYNW